MKEKKTFIYTQIMWTFWFCIEIVFKNRVVEPQYKNKSHRNIGSTLSLLNQVRSHIQAMREWQGDPPGERRISEISPPLLSGSELYKNLSFSRPMSIFCLLDPLLSPFTKLFPPFFTAFIFLLFFVQVQSSANGQPISLLCKAY